MNGWNPRGSLGVQLRNREERAQSPDSSSKLIDETRPAEPAVTLAKPSLLGRTFAALALPKFRSLWLGMLFSMGGMQIEIVAKAWLAYDLSGSAFILGLVALGRSLPQIILSPFAGVVADRFDRRKILIVSQTAMMLVSFVAAVLVQTGVIQVWHLLVLGLFQGIAFPFTMPTRTAFMSDLVERKDMANALALDSTGRNLNLIVAPSIAGILLAYNPMLAFYASALMYSLAVWTLFRLPGGSRGGAGKSGTFAEMAIGFRYIWSNRILFALMAMSAVPILLGMPFQQLLPVFQSDVLMVGESRVGFMFAAVGVGALVGSLGAAYFAGSSQMAKIQLACGVLFGIALIGFALSTIYLVALGFLVLVGLFSQTYLTINRSLLMLNTDPALYGRVTSVQIMAWYLMPATLLPMGFIADQVGVSYTVAGAGMLVALLIVTAALRFPALFLRPVDPTSPTAP
jgi:MFS family permease